jgi:hypothetical protein
MAVKGAEDKNYTILHGNAHCSVAYSSSFDLFLSLHTQTSPPQPFFFLHFNLFSQRFFKFDSLF